MTNGPMTVAQLAPKCQWQWLNWHQNEVPRLWHYLFCPPPSKPIVGLARSDASGWGQGHDYTTGTGNALENWWPNWKKTELTSEKAGKRNAVFPVGRDRKPGLGLNHAQNNPPGGGHGGLRVTGARGTWQKTGKKMEKGRKPGKGKEREKENKGKREEEERRNMIMMDSDHMSSNSWINIPRVCRIDMFFDPTPKFTFSLAHIEGSTRAVYNIHYPLSITGLERFGRSFWPLGRV